MSKEQERLDRLAQVSVWYYEDKLEQSEIARRIGRSISMVSRMLTEAHQEGLIEIRVRFALPTNRDLEKILVSKFGLASAHVLQSNASQTYYLHRKLGELGARCLLEYLHDGTTIGISWGRTLYQVVGAVAPLHLKNATVVQFMGAAGSSDPITAGSELARWLAGKLDAEFHFLHSPMVVENKDLAQSLLKDREIARVLKLARKADVALIGVGGVDTKQSTSIGAGHLTARDMAGLARAGAVGNVISRFIDMSGKEVDHRLNQRIVALDLVSLMHIPAVIGIAAGTDRVAAILGAIRGGYIKTLVTDSNTAQQVLHLDDEQTGR